MATPESNTPIVIHKGSGTIQIGFAQENSSPLSFPAVVGTESSTTNEFVVGEEALQHQNKLNLRYPIQHGVVTDWHAMEQVWAHAFNILDVDPSQHPVLISEAPLTPKANREKNYSDVI